MVTPDKQSIETAATDTNPKTAQMSSRGKETVDEDIAGLNRRSVAFVLVAFFGLSVSLAGLFTSQFYVVLAGVGFVALGALAWIGAVLAVSWKMARELLVARRASASQNSFGQSEQAPETR